MKNIKLPFFIVVLVVLAACSDPRPPEEIVAERAQARWDAIGERDFQKAWEFYSPGFREKTSAELFSVELARRPVRWESAEVQQVNCADQRCEVSVEVDYSVPGASGPLAGYEGSREVDEIWIELDGVWWYSSE